MNILFVFEIIIQVSLCVHVLKTGRNIIWLYIILIFPVIGSLIYFISEILPSFRFRPENFVRETTEDVTRKLNPIKKLQKLKEELEFSKTLKNKESLADEYLLCGFIDESIEMYKDCLTGSHKDDPRNTFNLAKAYYLKKDYQNSKEILEKLIGIHPNYRKGEVHLLLAENLKSLNEIELAENEYNIAINHFAGEEARFKYAIFLKDQSRIDESKELFNKIIRNVERSPKHVQKEQKKWIKQSRNYISK